MKKREIVFRMMAGVFFLIFSTEIMLAEPMMKPVPGDPVDFTMAADKSVPAVVHIKTSFTRKNAYYDDFFAPFYDFFNVQPFSQQYPINATGSGVIVSDDGYIVTNNHVVQDAEQISVTLNDKREFVATVVGLDPSTDLALIKIDEKNLPFLIFGNSDQVKIGEWVLAVGNPFNLTNTVTAGIVSAKARNINILGGGSSVESFIQTDAAVNPGNSGGALVNTKGELIGINAAIASNTGSYSGYSFAIPSNIASKVVSDLKEYGMVQRAYLGADIVDITAATAKQYGLSSMKGVYVSAVSDGGAAIEAGIEAGDVILSVGGEEVNSSSRLLELIAEKHPGDKLLLEIERGNKTISKPVTLLNRRGEKVLLKKEDPALSTFMGATFSEPDQQTMSRLRLKNGMQISELNEGALKNAGIKESFIVTKIDQTIIYSMEDIENALSGKSGGVLIEGVYPNGMKAYYGFGL
ncbi:MAG: Do family serine endopeptidase [Bacteroidales bacterium]|jgi:Do/DeqQ family serine protease|nr:Do family serine endopeptidase [Bacteroidales bacterium]